MYIYNYYSFHLGIGVDGVTTSSSSSYVAAIQVAEKLMSYGEGLGFEFSLLDIGGGFAGHPDQLSNIREWSVSVNECIEEVTAKHPHLNRVIAEPGA